MQKISRRGIEELASHEAIVLSPYLDSKNTWTIGIGHTANSGDPDPAKNRREFSIEEIMLIFSNDIEKFEKRIREAFARDLSQEQFDAAVSFDFNTGGISRASWVRYFNEGNDEKARDAFMLWDKPSAIIPRRKKECALFFDGKYSSNGHVSVYPASNSGEVLWKEGKQIELPKNIDTAATPHEVKQPHIKLQKIAPTKGQAVGVWVAAAAFGALIISWWDQATTWIRGLF